MQDVYYRTSADRDHFAADERRSRPFGADALQALLAFSALHQQVRKRRALAFKHKGFDSVPYPAEFEETEQFVLDEVLQLVAERAIAITGADGLARRARKSATWARRRIARSTAGHRRAKVRGSCIGLPAVELVGVRASALVLVQHRDVLDVGGGQLEVEDVDVLPDPVRGD